MMKNLVNLAIISSAVASGSNSSSSSSCMVSDSAKVDCGYAGIDQSGCVSKGCCWAPAGQNSATPWCFNAGPSAAGYALSGMVSTATGFEGNLQLIGSGSSTYGPDLKNLKLQVVFETADTVRVKITDAAQSRWEVPESVLPRPHATSKPASMNYKFTYTASPFSFEVVRLSDGRSVFKMDSALVFKDQYLEMTSSFAAGARTFGLGESSRLTHALTAGSTYSMWAADVPALVFNKNLYGSFPFYLQMVDGAAHGALLLNSNGMDVTLKDSALTLKTIGGVLDLYVFSGATPAEVVSQYTHIVGRPSLMPYWALGFHNCKYGYKSVYEVEDVVAKYAAAGIPLDTQWMDIDYMQNYRDFTFDSAVFPQAEVSAFVSKLHGDGQHFVPIVDPGIMVFEGYEAYERGLREDLFVKDISGGSYLGQVWPGPTYFPDFLHPSAQAYWTDQLQAFHSAVPVDGIWIDMNEVSNFCNSDGAGQVCSNAAPNGCPAPGASQTDCCLVCSTVDSTNRLDFPPYAIGNGQGNGRLGTKTIAASAVQYGNVSMYDAHNLYGLTEQMATNKALTDIRGKRPFLLTRSSFPSSGKHTAKWTGDNAATWDDLRSSLISIMDFSLFGIPMVGADICGFIYDTTEELCARWIELGAFYPFSRNHNALGNAPQELYLWDSVAAASRNALGIRYQLLPYLYSLLYAASVDGSMVARPLWANFPTDSVAQGVDRQLMLGSGLLVSPVLEQGAVAVSAYFPAGLWYRFGLWQEASAVDSSSSVISSAAGLWQTLSTPLTAVQAHVRGGTVLPLQQTAMTTTLGRQTPFTLVAALCPGGKAFGSLFWDDGEQVSVDSFLTVDYAAEASAPNAGYFAATVTHRSYSTALPVQEIAIVSASLSAPSKVTVNGAATSSFSFDALRHTLRIFGLSLQVQDSFKVEWN